MRLNGVSVLAQWDSFQMGDIPSDSPPSKGPSLYDTGGISPGGQVYTSTEIGKYVYGGETRDLPAL